MPKKRKTREEKIKGAYRLSNLKIKVEESQNRRDVQEFGYLSKDYIRKDLTKTVVYTVVVVGLLFLAKQYLG